MILKLMILMNPMLKKINFDEIYIHQYMFLNNEDCAV